MSAIMTSFSGPRLSSREASDGSSLLFHCFNFSSSPIFKYLNFKISNISNNQMFKFQIPKYLDGIIGTGCGYGWREVEVFSCLLESYCDLELFSNPNYMTAYFYFSNPFFKFWISVFFKIFLPCFKHCDLALFPNLTVSHMTHFDSSTGCWRRAQCTVRFELWTVHSALWTVNSA